MAFLIAVLLLATLFSENAHCMSENETTKTGEGNDAIFAVDTLSLFPLGLDEQKLLFGPKNKMPTLIGNLHPEDSNRTEDSLAVDGALVTDVNGTELPVTTPVNGTDVEGLTQTEPIDYDYSTESRFDSKGCDTHLRDQYEEDCFIKFHNAVTDSVHMEYQEQGKHICCASEGYERCCIVGYQEANCVTDWDAIKENLRAARMFMATISNTSCSLYRGKCESAAFRPPPPSFLLASLLFLPTILML